MLGLSEIAMRLVFSVIVGGLIGLEREVVHKPAGMRTHMLVCMGSALFVIIALEAFVNEVPRIMAGIATGIGFLGAGTIFKAKDDVHGLTTAASIWAVAAVGLAVGLGYYAIMLIAVILILIVLQLHKLNIFRNL
jgi:putative Mg2+ transporter-C (MgtC) family protein